MTARRKGRGWSGAGMTRLERQLGGNTAQDRKDIAAAAAVYRGKRYYQDLDGATGAAPAPKSAESDQNK
ncbi:hypothetical protein [Massilia brevitalea]|uniref:hypothetical protein n=1 Tax=Massilia brevitalea TaxID=442526 RepID=UPI002739B65D|nr:hypothetical protein [Massilia brevitalea]